MDAKEKYTRLLADERLQDEVRSFSGLSDEKQEAFLKKYSLTKNEFVYLKRFLDGFSFKQEEPNQEELSFAVNKLMAQVKDRSLSFQKTKDRKIDFVTWVSRIAAVFSIPLLLSTIYFYQKSVSFHSPDSTAAITEKATNTFQAPAGAKTHVVLPDGSLVWLNSGSTISVPTQFDANSRQVELTGEAYFEVKKNEQSPMLISTGNLLVKVYGTSFNVNAFADNGLVETTLVDGKVTLIIPGIDKKEYVLEPGFTAFYNIHNQKIQASKVEKMDAFTGWKDGKLLFHNQRFADIIRRLERWYNVDIQLTDPSLGNYTLYATFLDENIEQVLDIFSNSIPISVDYPKRKKQGDGTYSKRKIMVRRDTNKKLN